MPQFLLDILDSLSTEVPIEPITREQYARAIRYFGFHLGKAPTTENLNTEQVNRFLIALQKDRNLGPTSVRNYRTSIIRVWNFAHDPLDLVSACPNKRIRQPKRPEKRVVAWTKLEVGYLLKAASELTGVLQCGIPAKVFMKTLVNVAYDTGLRPSDTRLLRWEQFDFENMLVTVSQHKTGSLHTCPIRPETKLSMDELKVYSPELLFPIGKTGVWKWEQKLYFRAAKFGFKKVRGQGIGTLRKTHATEVYLERGIAAASHTLGHRGSLTTVQRHYIDSSTIRGYLPPSIGIPTGPT